MRPSRSYRFVTKSIQDISFTNSGRLLAIQLSFRLINNVCNNYYCISTPLTFMHILFIAVYSRSL